MPNAMFFSNTGDRPDLAKLEVNPPEGYIGFAIAPKYEVADKSGSLWYFPLTADSAAQTGRSPGVAPTAVQIASTYTSFSCAELFKRAAMTPDELTQIGDEAKAEIALTRHAKRSVLAAIEALVATATVGGTPAGTFDAASFLVQIQDALDATKGHGGKTVLVAGAATLRKLVQKLLAEESVGPMLARVVSGTAPNVATQGLSLAAWKAALQTLAGVDDVLIGDSAVWSAGSNAGRIAIGRISTGEDQLDHKYEAVFAKTVLFLPKGAETEWSVRVVADEINQNNYVDATIWAAVKTLNAGAMYVIDGVA